jgi:bifunctional polynucleotide phosphatase/kinase
MASHVRVNQDALGSQPACVAKVKQELLGGRSVVVDNTNLTKTVRASYIKLALECKAKVGAVVSALSNQ